MARDVTGTVIQQRTKNSTGAYASVAEVLDITAGDLTRERIDVTHLGSTAQTRSYIKGFIELGESTFRINYDAAQATHSGQTGGLAGLFTAGTTRDWRILPEGNTSQGNTFQGYVSRFTPQYTVGSQQIADVAVQVTTLPAFTT